MFTTAVAADIFVSVHVRTTRFAVCLYRYDDSVAPWSFSQRTLALVPSSLAISYILFMAILWSKAMLACQHFVVHSNGPASHACAVRSRIVVATTAVMVILVMIVAKNGGCGAPLQR